jgi:hypothetical protein
MSLPILLETTRKLLRSPTVLYVQFLGTKVQAYLPKNYVLDVYYNITFNKYSYTILKDGKRVIGWDNAPHHQQVKTHPHHFHNIEGNVIESTMQGNPVKDITEVLKEAKRLLKL